MRTVLVLIDPSQTTPIWDLFKYTATFMARLGTVLSVLLYVEIKESVLKCSLNVDVWNGSNQCGSPNFDYIGYIFIAPLELPCASLQALGHAPSMAGICLQQVCPIEPDGFRAAITCCHTACPSSLKAAPSLSAEQLPG